MINLTLSHNLLIENCPLPILEIAKNVLTIPNPSFHKISRIVGNAFVAPRDFKYYRNLPKKADCLQVPRGFISRFKGYLDKNSIEYQLTRQCVSVVANPQPWKPIELRDYQVPLVEGLVGETEGVLAASTGSGKTVIALEAIRRIGLKATIVCPTTVIQKQFVEEMWKWWGYVPGIINADSKTLGDITVAMWQSLSADEELVKKLAEETGVLIVDECQGIISPERSSILRQFKPERLYGLSGSARRSKDDGRTDAIFFYLGPIIASYETPMVKPVVEVIRTNVEIQASYNYHEMIDSLVDNENRNKLIIGLAVMEALSGHKVLILTKRRSHCQKLMEKLIDYSAFYADSDDPERNEVLMKMRAGEYEFSILVGTFSLLSAGLDIPVLDTLIIAADLKSDVSVQQSSGRILRLFEGKESAKIYDLFDNLNPILKRQFYERKKFYESVGWEVKT